MILQEKASKLEEENKFQGCPAVNESYTNNRTLVTPSAGSSRRGHDRCCYCCCRRRSNVRVGYSAVTERWPVMKCGRLLSFSVRERKFPPATAISNVRKFRLLLLLLPLPSPISASPRAKVPRWSWLKTKFLKTFHSSIFCFCRARLLQSN